MTNMGPDQNPLISQGSLVASAIHRSPCGDFDGMTGSYQNRPERIVHALHDSATGLPFRVETLLLQVELSLTGGLCAILDLQKQEPTTSRFD